jgi:hypothetical protein
MNLINRKNLLIISLLGETVFSSYGLLWGSQAGVVSILYLLASLVFIITLLFLPSAKLPEWSDIKYGSGFKLIVMLMMLWLAYITSSYWIDMIAIDPDYADMLPIMKVMNERLLHGHFSQIYEPIPEIWNGVQPIYLPAMWIPYAPAVAWGFDMRWITVISVLLSFIVVLIFVRLRNNIVYGVGQLLIILILFWWLFSKNEVHSLITMSEEGVVIFYFVLLCIAIIADNAFFMGITASICMLSRYSMIGWLIPCLFYFAARRDFRKLIIFSLTGVSCILLFFLIPFGWHTLEQMLKLPENYIGFAGTIWENTPEVFWLNPGLAKFFGPHHIMLLHKTLIISSFGIPVLFMVFCVFQKKWKFQNINLACFKLSLLVFYQLIDVPYGYLFYTGSFVSMVIAAVLLYKPQSFAVMPSSNI